MSRRHSPLLSSLAERTDGNDGRIRHSAESRRAMLCQKCHGQQPEDEGIDL